MKKSLRYLGLSAILLLSVAVVGCSGGGTEPTATNNDDKGQEPAAVVEAPEVVSLVKQVKDTAHYGFFSGMVEETANGADNHYGDGCIECHSAVKIVDDHDAKLADFLPGGKYADKGEGITCRVCHVMGGEEMFTLRNEGVESCGVCHTAEGIEVGKAVHHPQAEMFKGIAVGDVAEKASRKMGQDFACYTCHFTNGIDHDFQAPTVEEIVANKDCNTCHSDAAKFENQIKGIQDEVGGKLEDLKTRYDAANEALTAAKDAGKDVTAAEEALGAANTYITYVDADKSKGVHNPDYAKEVLKAGEAKLAEAEGMLK